MDNPGLTWSIALWCTDRSELLIKDTSWSCIPSFLLDLNDSFIPSICHEHVPRPELMLQRECGQCKQGRWASQAVSVYPARREPLIMTTDTTQNIKNSRAFARVSSWGLSNSGRFRGSILYLDSLKNWRLRKEMDFYGAPTMCQHDVYHFLYNSSMG